MCAACLQGERDQNNDDSVLHLVVHPDENVNMVQIGHLQHWFSGGTSEALVHAPPSLTSPHVLAQLVSGLFMFPNLRILNLTLAQPTLVLRQTVFCAIAELSQLRECYVQGGALLPGCDGIKLEVGRRMLQRPAQAARQSSSVHMICLKAMSNLVHC